MTVYKKRLEDVAEGVVVVDVVGEAEEEVDAVS